MGKFRQPFPWEPQNELQPQSIDPTRFLVMPTEDRPGSRLALAEGEFDCRGTMDVIRGRLLAEGASPEWAEQKARKAARSWDAGVRSGQIKR